MLALLIGDAPRGSNLNLTAQLLMGLTLLIGAYLARQKKFHAHAVCQTLVICLNFIPITIYMGPIFHRGVLPKIPALLGQPFYALPAMHATLGTLAEALGIYIILRAGTNLLPAALRFKNLKLWMRAELLLWWIVISLGISTYFVWYKVDAQPSTTVTQVAVNPVGTSQEPPKQIITLSNFAFNPKELIIEPGTIVVWKDTMGRHTVKADDGSFESDVLAVGGEFQYRFDRAGRFLFHCTLHGAPGGHDMAGVITVQARIP